ncbi:hypothetical protein CHUAL_008487 [Chamberlinius hualienensis]
MCWDTFKVPLASIETIRVIWGLVVIFGILLSTLVSVIVIAFVVLYALRMRIMVRNFRKKAVFITGGDKGFGKAMVMELDKKGLIVFAGCHSKAGADSLRPFVSDRVKTVIIEVTDRQSVENAKKVIEADLPPQGLWGLVNNAGIARGIVFDFAQIKDYREVLEVNFFGAINVTEVFLPLIKKSKGRIVNISSIMGRFSGVMGPYSCSKYALEAYTDGLRRSLNAFGIKVTAIEPGFYRTKMTEWKYIEDEIDRLYDALPDHYKDDYDLEAKEKAKAKFGKFLRNPPLSNWNKVEDVAMAVVHSLGGRYPWARYVCGLDAHLLYKGASVVPDSIVDLFFPLIGPVGCYDSPKHRKRHQKAMSNGHQTTIKNGNEKLIENICHD